MCKIMVNFIVYFKLFTEFFFSLYNGRSDQNNIFLLTVGTIELSPERKLKAIIMQYKNM